MNTGVVKFYSKEGKYGFIISDADDKEIFFHKTGLAAGEVTKDDKVSYDEGENNKGRCAINVKKY